MINVDWSTASRRTINGYIVLRKTIDKVHYRKAEHVLIWESVNGEKPPRTHIHHINGVKDDNRIENLLLMSDREHTRFHAGFKLIDGEWWKPCALCGELKLLSQDFFSNGAKKYGSFCKICDAKRSVEYRNFMKDSNKELFVARRKEQNKQYYLKKKSDADFILRKKETAKRCRLKKKNLGG